MSSRRALRLVLGTLGVLAVAAALGALGTLPGHAQAPVEVSTQLGWIRNGEFAPIMVADAKGFFAAEGIRHKILDGGPGKSPVPLVAAGRAQFGITASGSSVFQARLAIDPIDVVAVGTILQTGPYAYITLTGPNDPDPKPKDLEGKVLGMQADGDFFLQAFAKKHNLDLSKIKVEVVQATPEPLLVGKVDFFTGWVTNQTYAIDQELAKPDATARLKGKVWKSMRFAELGVPSYSDVIFTTGKMVKENPELVRRYLRAVSRAMQYILDHNDETVRLVAAYPEQVEKADKLIWRWKIQNKFFVSEDTRKNGLLWMNPRVWTEMMTFYKEYERIPRVAPAEEVMTNALLPAR
jgi:NitT/TauT family transport system substrate-binding protein